MGLSDEEDTIKQATAISSGVNPFTLAHASSGIVILEQPVSVEVSPGVWQHFQETHAWVYVAPLTFRSTLARASVSHFSN